jgi:hypothetical protein
MFVSEVETETAPTDLEIEDRLADSFLAENRLVRRRLADIVELDRREAYRVDGARSMVDWLCYRFDLAARSAREYLRVGRALEFLPALADAFEEGVISWDKLRAVTWFATPDEDVALARDVAMLNTAQVLMLARHRRRLARRHAARRRRQRELHTRWDEDEGMLQIWGQIPDADGAAVRKALDILASDSPRDLDGSFAAPYAQRCADALVSLCGGHLGSQADPDRASVNVYADARALSADTGTATIEGGIPIAPETLRRLTCDGRIRPVFTGKNGDVVGVGRMQRTVPAWLLAEIKRRDAGCRWEGCSNTRWLHAHHVKHWAHGGGTDADNIVMLCGYHHREVHEGGADVRLSHTGRVTCVRSDGRPLGGHRRTMSTARAP